jgi:putative endonuclease
MSLLKKRFGADGETLAVSYLQKKGYKILIRNFRIRNSEIDIIATKDKTLIFIEVKTRTSVRFGTPFEAITHWKLEAMMRGAQVFKLQYPKTPDAMRFDAIAVLVDASGEETIEHIENITS